MRLQDNGGRIYGKSEEIKKALIREYDLSYNEKIMIIGTFSSQGKLEALINKEVFSEDIVLSLDLKDLAILLNKEHKSILDENFTEPFMIIMRLNQEGQKEFVEDFMEETGLSSEDKKKILTFLDQNVKTKLDISSFSDEYKRAISIQTEELNVIVDLNRSPEEYIGYDDVINVNPEGYNDEQRSKFIKLCELCPGLHVRSEHFNFSQKNGYYSTGKEYIEAEKWIQEVIDKLNPEWSDAQKIAVIDNTIGKKISYSPEIDTEIFREDECRALWKIICSGYGVCNGVADVEHYILNRIGIESEIIGSKNHAFLKIKNIEVPFANGEIKVGNTIVDPTWNLAVHRFGGRPKNFFISYEEVRKYDLLSDGQDSGCHKNDEALRDTNLNIDEQSLRKLFASVGLANEDGQFPFKDLKEKSDTLHRIYALNPEKDIKEQFDLLAKEHPNFTQCQNSSMGLIMMMLDEVEFDKGAVNRVYDKRDEERKPILYVYIESEEFGRKFYYADKEKGQMVELPEEEFIKRFECYDMDLEKSNGVRPWESKEKEQEKVDLSRSSGMVATNKSLDSYSEGDER